MNTLTQLYKELAFNRGEQISAAKFGGVEWHAREHELMKQETELVDRIRVLEDDTVLFQKCAEAVVASQNGSAGFLQRYLNIDHDDAGRMLDKLEEKKIIAPFEGSKTRAVLIKSLAELNLHLQYKNV